MDRVSSSAPSVPSASSRALGGRLRLARWLPCALALTAVAGACGGSGGGGGTTPVGQWTATGNMGAARVAHSATALADGRVLVVGGSGGQAGPLLASAELYHPSTGAFTATAPLPVAREGHAAVLLPSGVLVVGGGAGRWSPGALASDPSAWRYDPATGTWSSEGSMHIARYGPTATLLPSGLVLVAGGEPSASGTDGTETAELFDPATHTWTMAEPMHVPRTGHVAVLLPSGKVLVAGGTSTDAAGSLASAELYDPATGTWTVTGSMPFAAFAPGATLLPSGQILVAGGVLGQGGTWTRRAEAALYDPATGTWTATGRMSSGRGSTPAVLLPSGRVVVSAGGHVTAVGTEVFDPAKGEWSTGASPPLDHGDCAAAAALPDGRVLLTGGFSFSRGWVALSNAELFSE